MALASGVAIDLVARFTSTPSRRDQICAPYRTIQQNRMAIPGNAAHRFLVHDRDAIYAPAVDRVIASMGLRVLKTPARTPQAKDYASYCTSLV